MKRALLSCCWFLLIALTVAWGYHTLTMPVEAPEPDERLTLSTPRKEYLLGEPVVLDLSFRNQSKEAIKLVQVHDAPVWIAHAAERFRKFTFSDQFDFAESRKFSLEPGGIWKCQYRVVGHSAGKPRLAFPEPGDYRVYVDTPVYVAWALDNEYKPSNVVEVRVKKPEGEDAKVWQKLNDPKCLTLLQIEAVIWGNESDSQPLAGVLKMGEILRDHPNSGYTPAMRHVLNKLSPDLRNHLSFEQATLLGDALAIKGYARVEEDPKDKRLDAIRKDSFEKWTTIGQVLTSLSKACGVPLDAPADVKATPILIADSLTTVRQCMGVLRGAFGKWKDSDWERRGDGYFLVPVPIQAAREKQPEGKEKPAEQPKP